MKLPLTNIELFTKFNYNDTNYENMGDNHLFEAFHVSNDDVVYHLISGKDNNSEGIEMFWEDNPFELSYTKDNFIRIIK